MNSQHESPWICYLATPIDHVIDFHSIRVRRESLRNLLVSHGAAVYDPAAAWSGQPVQGIGWVNDKALGQADALLAWIPKGVPTVGVPTEVQRFVHKGRPVAVLGVSSISFDERVVQFTEEAWGSTDAAEYAACSWLCSKIGGDHENTTMFHNVPTSRPQVDDPLPAFMQLVEHEIERANIKHPYSDQHTKERWFGIWMEEVLEAIRDWNDLQNPEDAQGDASLASLREELIQVGAMTQRFWQSVDEYL